MTHAGFFSRTAPAHFAGVQDGCGIFPSFALFTLDAPVGIHPVGSTVSQQTLEKHGFSAPPIPTEEHADLVGAVRW